MLKNHGISMLTDDTDNTLFNSALQNGRKLVLSDAGKLLLNDIKYKKFVTTSSSASNNNEMPSTITTSMSKVTTNPIKRPVLMAATGKQPIPAANIKTFKGSTAVKKASVNE